MTAKTLRVYGEHGRKVRVYLETTTTGTRYVRVRWREGRKRKTESFHDTRENRERAHAYAKGVAHRLDQRTAPPPAPISLWDLYNKYLAANTHWRPKTRKNNEARWKKFQAFAGMGRAAHTVTMEMLDEFRADMRRSDAARGGKPHAVNQVGEHVKVVKAVFRFARLRRLIPENPLADYVVKLPKDQVRDEMAEYTNEEWGAVLSQLSPRRAREWRPYCFVLLAGVLATRQNALRELRWADVNLEERFIQWPASTDKMGRERRQPLPRAAVRALRIARVWARRDKYAGELVFYGANARTRDKDKAYTYAALNAALLVAERAAGVLHIAYRAMHGYRRTSGGNVLDATNDPYQAMEWLGQTDLRTTMRYLKKRQVRQRELAKLVTAPEHAAKGGEEKATKKQSAPKDGAPETVSSRKEAVSDLS